MHDIIGVPCDLFGRRPGSALGPQAIRLAGLNSCLEAIGYAPRDLRDLPVPIPEERGDGLKYFPEAFETYRLTKGVVLDSLAEGRWPIVLGGDHSISIGSISAALEHAKEQLAVLWIDAHADLHHPGTSNSGNLHGMPLGALLGRHSQGEGPIARDWERLLREMVPQDRLPSDRIAWFGLRDVDPEECDAIETLEGAFVSTMEHVDRYGIERVMRSFDKWMRGTKASALWISFDVDVLDPVFAPGTGTAVRGGLTYREAHLLAELLYEMMQESECPYQLLGVDIVETNPIADHNNETAKMAVEWIGSLFGKKILTGRRTFEF